MTHICVENCIHTIRSSFHGVIANRLHGDRIRVQRLSDVSTYGGESVGENIVHRFFQNAQVEEDL